jgi:heterodisulfide reductase subunit B
MKYLYYPGCTLSTKAKNLDRSARRSMKTLGVELQELSHWNCCGTTFPLVIDNVMSLLAPARVLADASAEGDRVVTICAFCYHVLKRTSSILQREEDTRKKIGLFLADEGRSLSENLRVVHLLELLRDEVGFDAVRAAVKRPLSGLKVAPYYGCQVLRPSEELALDDIEYPQIMFDFLQSLGCEVIRIPYETECCGSYLSLTSEEAAVQCSWRILSSALRCGVEALSVTCPLCQFNLEHNQLKLREGKGEAIELPVLYFTELLAIALGEDMSEEDAALHFVDCRTFFQEKALS